MKTSWIAACSAVLILALTGCGGGSVSSPPTSATPAPKVVPNVVGKTATDAVAAMNNALLKSVFVGSDGLAWTKGASSAVKVVSTDPPAGATATSDTVVKLTLDTTQAAADASKAAADAAAAKASAAASMAAELAIRYTVTCESSTKMGDFDDFKSYKDVWKSPDYQSSGHCFTDIDGKNPDSTTKIPLLPSEQAIVDIVASKGGGTKYPDDTFASVYSLCATVPKDFPSTIMGGSSNVDMRAEIQGALALCPDAPHAALLQQALNAVNYSDGSYTVGKTMEAGTYSTGPGARNCYWSRTTGGGAIIANDFIDYAPDGATVTVYPGEGFTSNNCGVWTKVG